MTVLTEAGRDRVAGQFGVSRETIDRLGVFAAELEKWAGRINLIGPGTAADIWYRHILDSLQLLRHVERPSTWLDFGTGAGLPGMVIAAAMEDREGAVVHLVESNRKKTAFLKTVRRAVAPRAIIHDKRIEDVVATMDAPDVVSARAVAPLPVLFDWISPWRNPDLVCLFPKGRGYEKEMADIESRWQYDCRIHPSDIDDQSVVLQFGNIRHV